MASRTEARWGAVRWLLRGSRRCSRSLLAVQCELSLSCSSRWARARGRASQSGRSSSSFASSRSPSPSRHFTAQCYLVVQLDTPSAPKISQPSRPRPHSPSPRCAALSRPSPALRPAHLADAPTCLALHSHSTASYTSPARRRTPLLSPSTDEKPPRPLDLLFRRSCPSLSSHTARHSLTILARGTATPHKTVDRPRALRRLGRVAPDVGAVLPLRRIDPRSALAPPILAQSGPLSPLDRLRDAVH